MMNAGAYGGEMKDVVTHVSVVTEEGELRSELSDEGQREEPAKGATPAQSGAGTAAPAEEEMPPPPTAAEQAGQHEEYRKGTKQLDDLLNGVESIQQTARDTEKLLSTLEV